MKRKVHAEYHHEKRSECSEKGEIYAYRHAKFQQFLQPNQQHSLIKVSECNTCVRYIHKDQDIMPEGKSKSDRSIVISLKSVNQGSMALAHNPIFHSLTNRIDIHHQYICHEVASKRIKLSYIPTDKMIAEGFPKAPTHVKFHCFLRQTNII